MIERIFHPVGQGAFYSEKHDIENNYFNIVYDCGSKQKKKAIPVVSKSFNINESIDILFISHFDYDHVSLIETLKNNFKIKTVVLPLLHSEEIFLLSTLFDSKDEKNLSSLVSRPEEFFGEATSIVRVRATEARKEPEELGKISSSDIPNTIDSGTAITLLNIDWAYIPFNYDYKKRNKDLKSLFVSEGIDIKRLKKDRDYLNNNRAKIRKIYSQLQGTVNQNSMLVYSGPLSSNNYKRNYQFCQSCSTPIYYNRIDNRLNRVACVFTGDMNLNTIVLRDIYNSIWKYVGTIQIPHHGDAHSFDKNILRPLHEVSFSNLF